MTVPSLFGFVGRKHGDADADSFQRRPENLVRRAVGKPIEKLTMIGGPAGSGRGWPGSSRSVLAFNRCAERADKRNQSPHQTAKLPLEGDELPTSRQGREGRLPSLQRRVGRGNAVFPPSDAWSEQGTPSSRFPRSCRKQGKPSSLLPTRRLRRERRVPGLQ